MRNIKALKGIPTIVVTCASCNSSATVYLNQKLWFKKNRNYTRNVIKFLVYFRKLNNHLGILIPCEPSAGLSVMNLLCLAVSGIAVVL